MILTLKGKILAGAVEKITLFDGQFDTAFQIKSIVVCPEDILTSEAVTVKLMTEEAAHNTDWFWAKNTEVGWAAWGVPTSSRFAQFSRVDKEALIVVLILEGSQILRNGMRTTRDKSSDPVESIINCGLNYYDFAAAHPAHFRLMFGGNINELRKKYPELTDDELEEVRQHLVIDAAIKGSSIKEVGDKRFIRMANSFIDIDDINIDLIDSINPFQKAFEVMSKSVTKEVLKVIQNVIHSSRINMDFEEAKILWPKVQEFVKANNKEPNIKSSDPREQRLAECVIYLKEQKRLKTQSG